METIQRFSLKEGTSDRWEWRGRGGRSYSVKAAYSEIMKRSSSPNNVTTTADDDIFSKIWRAQAPLKVKVYTWRLILDRLPVIENLQKRNVANPMQPLCNCCNSELETATHLFLECAEVKKIWYKIMAWIGVSWAEPRDVTGHWKCFSNLLGKGKFKKRMSGLWSSVIWVLWKWRNSVIFEGSRWDMRRIVVEIQCRF